MDRAPDPELAHPIERAFGKLKLRMTVKGRKGPARCGPDCPSLARVHELEDVVASLQAQIVADRSGLDEKLRTIEERRGA